MKRCPKCSFLYLDTDEVCDLDGTALTDVNESELEPSLRSQSAAVDEKHDVPARGRTRLLVTGLIGLLLGVIPAAGYLMIMKSAAIDEQAIARITVPSSVVPSTIPTATPLPVSEAAASQPEPPAASPSPKATKVSVSNNPVSTTANSAQGQSVIRLTNGSRIDADEIWRTKEGVWYRRKGMVTLVKANQIRAIEKSGRK